MCDRWTIDKVIAVVEVILKTMKHNGLVFQPVFDYLETVANTNKVIAWNSKELSNDSINHS